MKSQEKGTSQHIHHMMFWMMATTLLLMTSAYAGDTNTVFDPCTDTKVGRLDGFTFGLAFSARNSFFLNQTQLSPCDSRLSLPAKGAELALFRPKVDEVSLLTINSSIFNSSRGYMVAFAGRGFAARSLPTFVADDNYVVTSFTLVLEFQKGTLQGLFWKKFGCGAGSCTGSPFVCLNNTDCAITKSNCRSNGGTTGCDIGIQLAFSGTDKNQKVLNSWYEVENLRQYSLLGLYSGLRSSLTSAFNGLL